jgi:hypothetical protein
LLIGVVAEPQRGSTQDRWLSTVPVHNLALAPGFLAAVGPTEIEAAELQPVLAGDPPMIDCPPDESYANTQLLTWLEDPTWFSVRLLTGDHAARRMWARQLVALMRTWGWSAGFLSERATPHGMSIVGQVTTGLLLVVERADTRGRQTAELLDVLGRRPGRDSARYGAAPVRMLLSAPAAEDWWEELRSDALLLRDLPAGTVVRLPGR